MYSHSESRHQLKRSATAIMCLDRLHAQHRHTQHHGGCDYALQPDQAAFHAPNHHIAVALILMVHGVHMGTRQRLGSLSSTAQHAAQTDTGAVVRVPHMSPIRNQAIFKTSHTYASPRQRQQPAIVVKWCQNLPCSKHPQPVRNTVLLLAHNQEYTVLLPTCMKLGR